METEKVDTEHKGHSKNQSDFVQRSKRPGPFMPISTCMNNEIDMLSHSDSSSYSESDESSLIDTNLNHGKANNLILQAQKLLGFPAQTKQEESESEEYSELKLNETQIKQDDLLSNLHGIEDFVEVIANNKELILNSLTEEEKKSMFKHLPADCEDPDSLFIEILCNGVQAPKNLAGKTPLEQFGNELSDNKFTKEYMELEKAKQLLSLLDKQDNLQIELERVRAVEKDEDQLARQVLDGMFEIKNLHKPQEAYSDDSSDSNAQPMLEEEEQMYNRVHEAQDEVTSGYSTISSSMEEAYLVSRHIHNREQHKQRLLQQVQLSLNSADQDQSTESCEKLQAQNGKKSNKELVVKLGKNGAPIRKEIGDKQLLGKNSGKSSVKKLKFKNSGVQDENPQHAVQKPFVETELNKELDRLMKTERFCNLRVHKNQKTHSRKSSQKTLPQFMPEDTDLYRVQEERRYRYPDKPWVYYNGDGTTSIVGPVIKKKSQQLNQKLRKDNFCKPREHPHLNSTRPAVVTLLCLARDAASRLPDGVGTRADIIEVIQQSQWIKVDTASQQQVDQLNCIVSGALDRLHYEPDQCVRYDAEKKLWIYQHKDRAIDDHKWLIKTPEINIKYQEEEKEGKFAPFTLQTNSFMPDPEHPMNDKWNKSVHKEKNPNPVDYTLTAWTNEKVTPAKINKLTPIQQTQQMIDTAKQNNQNNVQVKLLNANRDPAARKGMICVPVSSGLLLQNQQNQQQMLPRLPTQNQLAGQRRNYTEAVLHPYTEAFAHIQNNQSSNQNNNNSDNHQHYHQNNHQQ